MFNVAINGKEALKNFDIVAAAGAKDKATIQEIPAKANDLGQIVIDFTTVKDGAKCSGIEIIK